jgi:DNA helicase HerA-like ATPase
MTKLDADTLLTAVDNHAPISAADFERDVAYAAQTSWCDKAYKERFEEAADEIWNAIDEMGQIVEVEDMIEAAHAILDVAEQSGKLSDTQLDELGDLREWVDQKGSMYNFKRTLRDA